MKDMRLPHMLPKDLEFIKSAEDEQDLFNRLTTSLQKALLFFETAADDNVWLELYPSFITKLLKWFTQFYFEGQLSRENAEYIRDIIYSHAISLYPLIYYDLEISPFKTNSILLGLSSPYFEDLIRGAKDKGKQTLKIGSFDPSTFEMVLSLIHQGMDNLIRKDEEEIEKIVILAKKFSIKELEKEGERILCRYITQENAIDKLLQAHKNKWWDLKKGAANYFNSLDLGLKLHVDENQLTVNFSDFKTLTTLETYKKIAPITTGIRFPESLIQQKEIEEVIKESPKLVTLDLSESSKSPINWDIFPTSLTTLILNQASFLDKATLEIIVKRFYRLETLELEDQNSLGYEAWILINQLKGLRNLNLKGCRQVQDAHLGMMIMGLRGLENLNLSGLKLLTSRPLQDTLRNFPYLKKINLNKTFSNDQNLSDFTVSFPALEEIDASYTQISEKGVDNLLRLNPRIKKINVKGSIASDAIERLNKKFQDRIEDISF